MCSCTYLSASALKLVTLLELTQAPRIPEAELAAWRAFLAAHARIVGDIEAALREEELPPLSWYDVLWPLFRAPDRRLRRMWPAYAGVIQGFLSQVGSDRETLRQTLERVARGQPDD